MKLVFGEAESDPLRQWLRGRGGVVTSRIAEIELARTALRLGLDPDAGPIAEVRSALAIVPLTEAVLRDARRVGAPVLRTLDAVHLASALAVRDAIEVFVTYDLRLAASARAAGIAVEAPGKVDAA